MVPLWEPERKSDGLFVVTWKGQEEGNPCESNPANFCQVAPNAGTVWELHGDIAKEAIYFLAKKFLYVFYEV